MAVPGRTLIFALVALALVMMLARTIPRARFAQLRWPFVAASGLVWAALSAFLAWGFWDIYYSHFYPDSVRLLLPAAGVEYALLALLLWWVAVRLPLQPVITVCLLGGVESLLEHFLGIQYFGILNLPILQNETPLSIYTFAFFEYIIYWSVALLLALGIQQFILALKTRKVRPA